LLSHALSESALRDQEPLLNSYFDLLIRKLYEQVNGPSKGKVEIVRWFNFTTFDLIGDLCFGESFDALRNEEYHSWIAQIFAGLKFARLFRLFRQYPLFGYPILASLQLFPSLSKARYRHAQYTKDKTARRLDAQTERRDFMSYILRHNDEKGMTRAEITKTSALLIIAGSETSATLLSGATFHLLKNPGKMHKLTAEIRGAFSDTASMTFLELARLPYLNACLREAFRMYPPVPGVLPRRTLPGGAVIAGHFIPEDVCFPPPRHPLPVMSEIKLTLARSPSVSTTGARAARPRTSPIPTNTSRSAGWAMSGTSTITSPPCSRSRSARATVSVRWVIMRDWECVRCADSCR